MRYERKIVGSNLYWISLLAVAAFLFMRFMGGDLINWDYLGFEVVFPFYSAMMTGECVKTRSDPMFEVIEAQSNSLLHWIFTRYFYSFVTTGAFVVPGILISYIVNRLFGLGELLFVYLSTAFFLSSFVILCSLFTKSSHAAVAACGVYWLFSLLARSLLRFSFVPYIYPLIRFADEDNPLWIQNKFILIAVGIIIWFVVSIVCKKHTAFAD